METMVNGNPEDIVISGIAGKFPESDNMKILQENIFNKADLGTDDNRRWIHRKAFVLHKALYKREKASVCEYIPVRASERIEERKE